MRRFLQYLFLLPLVVEPACSARDDADANANANADDRDERVAAEKQPLLASSQLLWPMVDGKATIRVCFLPFDTGGLVFPLPQYAPDLSKVIPERKQWVREVVEAEWNAKTVVQFVGWQDCSVEDADIHIQLIGSQVVPDCNGNTVGGTSCVEHIGIRDKGKRVFINAFWGDEVLYSARYIETVNQQTYDRSEDLPRSNYPVICSATVQKALMIGSVTDQDIADMWAIYKPCMQNMAAHEFGHLAGFSHEQQRKDVTPDCAARYPASAPEAPTDEDTPLGPFDVESIMSYCRSYVPPTLTDEDVQQTNAVYAKLAPKTTTTPPSQAGDAGSSRPTKGVDAGSSDPSGDDSSDPTPTKTTTTRSTGGCSPR